MKRDDNARDAVFAVVLAAGDSRRFGGTKLLERLHGDTLVRRAACLARACCAERSVLVTGHRARDVAAAAGGACAIVLENRGYRDGIGTSIALAARALADRADALLLLLADQPLIETAHLERIIGAWRAADEIVATAFAGTRGPPVLMPKATFQDLATLSGDRGARTLFDDARFRVHSIEFDPAGVDVDTAEDLARLRRAARNG